MEGEDGSVETYVGQSAPQWKFRFNNHTASFKHSSKRTHTRLSGYIWRLKDQRIGYTIKWRILARAKALPRPFRLSPFNQQTTFLKLI